jgi:tetratricopeptide (TPR) repeat protein
VGLLTCAAVPRASGAEPAAVREPEPPEWRSGIAPGSNPPIFGRENPFELRLDRSELPKHSTGISDILVQLYDTELGRWRGYGLMKLRRERAEAGPVRVTGASINFVAPAEGIYSLRAVSRSAAGRIEAMPDDLTRVHWTVVYDRTPPKITLLKPRQSDRAYRPGSRVTIQWEYDENQPEDYPAVGDGVHRVEVSHDGGLTWKLIRKCAEPEKVYWKVQGPDTDAFLIRVTARDAAGNVGLVTTGPGMRFAGFKHVVGDPAQLPSAAARTYQRGVIYMTRGAYPQAAEHFNEAIRLDRNMLRAYVDLSATYLQMWDQERTRSRLPNRDHLEKVVKLLGDALKISGFDREVSLHYNLAQALERLSRLDEAGARLARGLAVAPRHVPSLYSMAYLHWRQRENASRLGDLEKTRAHTVEAKKLWEQVAALGGREHPLARQAVRCLAVLEHIKRMEQEEAMEKKRRRVERAAEAVAPLPGGMQLQ